jgi:exportin-1
VCKSLVYWCPAAVQVGSLQMPPEFDSHFGTFYRMFSQQLVAILPPNTNLAAAYDAGTDEQQAFVQNLALVYTGFFKVCGLAGSGRGRVLPA